MPTLPDLKPPRFTSDEPQTLVPSGTSLLSLVQHLTTAEVTWFQIRFVGSQSCDPGAAADDGLAVTEHLARYRKAIAKDNEIVGLAPSLEQLCAADDYADVDLRWVLVHMLEETARHAGHADIIREQIDGVTGR